MPLHRETEAYVMRLPHPVGERFGKRQQSLNGLSLPPRTLRLVEAYRIALTAKLGAVQIRDLRGSACGRRCTTQEIAASAGALEQMWKSVAYERT
jgi:hypothetical protein